MSEHRTGYVRGNVVELDAPVPSLDRRRVIVLLEAVDEAATDRDELACAWSHWIAAGPHDPIEDDDLGFPS